MSYVEPWRASGGILVGPAQHQSRSVFLRGTGASSLCLRGKDGTEFRIIALFQLLDLAPKILVSGQQGSHRGAPNGDVDWHGETDADIPAGGCQDRSVDANDPTLQVDERTA